MTLMPTFNCNTTLRFARSETKLCFSSLRFRVIWRICGIMARLALANHFVLVLVSHNCFLRHSIIGGMDTRARRPCSSKSGSSPVANSLDTTSRFGLTATHSNQRSRDPLCHLSAHEELLSHPTIPFKTASELMKLYYPHCVADSPKSTSTITLSSTSSRPSSPQTGSPTTSADWNSQDSWYMWNGGEFE